MSQLISWRTIILVLALALVAVACDPTDDADVSSDAANGEQPTEPAQDQTDDVQPEDHRDEADDPDGPALPEGLPAQLVGLTDDHRLVLVDTTNGEEIRTLYTFDDPLTYDQQPDAVPAGGAFFDGVWLSPGGEQLYTAICCEPAAGSIHGIPTAAGGDSEHIGAFLSLTPSPDGDRFAAQVYPTGDEPQAEIALLDRDLSEQQRFLAGAAYQPFVVDAPVWSRDGQRLAFVNEDGALLVLDVDTAESLDDAQVVPQPADGRFFRKPAFDADGRLLALLQDTPGHVEDISVGQAAADQLMTIDADELFSAERTASEIHDLPRTAREHSIDATGRFSVIVLADGSVMWRGQGSEGTLDLDVDLLTATW